MQKFLFKNELFFDHSVRIVPQVSSETSLPWLVQNKPSAPIRRDKTGLNSSKDNFIAKSFRLSTNRKLSILLNVLFPFVSFVGVFSILKWKTLVLKTTTSWTRASHSVHGWHLQRCQIRFFPQARFRRRTFHEPNLTRIKTDPNYLNRLNWFRRRS